MRWLAFVLVFGCKTSAHEEAPSAGSARSVPAAIDAAMAIDAMVIDAMVIDAAVIDAAVIDAAVIDAPPAPKAKQKRKSSREACLEKCNKRNMYTDCADSEGGMMPCPCHCD